MTDMRHVMEEIRQKRIIAIVRGQDPQTCLRLAEAYLAGGLSLIEITFDFRTPEKWAETERAIRAIKARFGRDVCVGAGSVLCAEQLERCRQAGGEYMIAPHVDASLIRSCAEKGLVAIPGAFTPSEAVAAYGAGAHFVKLFPAATLGPGYVKAIRAPLPHIPFLAVGGIDAQNVASFIEAGCVGAGVGGSLTSPAWIADAAWARITDAARRLAENAQAAR
jgi:2-dehydro-3-deoxyphosphogluconate aldolase/(4S)-4-hydroxy-2-oxoglutarate aldolase